MPYIFHQKYDLMMKNMKMGHHEVREEIPCASLAWRRMALARKAIFCLLMLLVACLAHAGGDCVLAAAKAGDDAQKSAEKVDRQETVEKPGVFNTKYYTASLPDDWKALSEPAENQGLNVAVFSQKGGNTMITLMAAANHGESAKTIAEIFAEQFKSTRSPVEKNGQYTFKFLSQNKQRQAWIACDGDSFMLSIIYGNRSEGMDFIRKNIRSRDYPGLLPR